MAYRVKGSTLRSKLAYVEASFGGAARAHLETLLDARDIPQLLDSGWYDFQLFVDLLEEIAATHFGGDLSRLTDIGRFSAEQALSTTYRTYGDRETFVAFLSSIGRLHTLFYSEGQVTVTVDAEAGRAVLEQSGKSRSAEADLFVAQGFYVRTAELYGCRDVRCSFEVLPGGARFELEWRI